jgi:pimeloyl-ACP methyl ester carboxylesterase
MKLPPPEVVKFSTPDKIDLLLTRYRGGDKGPVMVVHGVSVWSGMFAVPTVRENFAQFLTRHGYDVWLLDWRASIRLPIRQFTLDEAAANDFPAAVECILSRTGSPSVQAVVHCVGSIAFFMSMAQGLLPQVRCVACSQVAMHPVVGTIMRIKARIGLASLVAAMDVTHVSPLPDPKYKMFNAFLHLYANSLHHECDSTICHRMTFMFGHLYPHRSVNLDTHVDIPEQYGPCNVTTLKHLQQAARLGYLAKFDYGPEGNRARYGSQSAPSYLAGATHFRRPITLVSGAVNRVFIPESTMRTWQWLSENNGPDLYTRKVIPGFGHFDNFVGAEANQFCYPAYLEQLERVPER